MITYADEFDLDVRVGFGGTRAGVMILFARQPIGTGEGNTCDNRHTCLTHATQCHQVTCVGTQCDTCPNTCAPTCQTCQTQCNQNTCAATCQTCQTQCNQNTCAATCQTCQTQCNQNTCAQTCQTCQTRCNQDTCAATCQTCATDCGQNTCRATCGDDCQTQLGTHCPSCRC